MHYSPLTTLRVASLIAVLLLGGCLAMPAPPPLILTKINSARVTLRKVWFEERGGRLFLSGHVFRHYPPADEDTSGTHLLIALFPAGANTYEAAG